MNMFDSETQMFLLDGVNGAAGFAVNWLLQSTLLISIGLIVGALLRPRGSAVQSLVYRTTCLLYTSPSPRDRQKSRMPSSA